MNLLKKIQQFFSYWYLRYLLATELYMVETWEKVVVHITFAVLFGLVWIFNYSIVLNSVSQFRGHSNHAELSNSNSNHLLQNIGKT